MGDAGSPVGRVKLPRFFIAPHAAGADRIVFGATQQAQIRRVLRLHDGDRVIVCDGHGGARVATLRFDRGAVWGETGEYLPESPPPRRAVWLYQSALRGDRFTWLLQKGTEIGVRGFVPVRFDHTQPADYAARHDRYEAIVREAAEQCERTILPDIAAPLSFATALEHSAGHPGALRLLLDEEEHLASLRRMLTAAAETVCLFVGPEGGITAGERAAARSAGLQPVSLGTAILRSETAGLVAATLALAAGGDLG